MITITYYKVDFKEYKDHGFIYRFPLSKGRGEQSWAYSRELIVEQIEALEVESDHFEQFCNNIDKHIQANGSTTIF